MKKNSQPQESQIEPSMAENSPASKSKQALCDDFSASEQSGNEYCHILEKLLN